MPLPDRRVAAVRLAAPRAELVRRGAVLLEDALRTASGPGDGGRLLLVRRVEVGRISAARASAAVASVLERRFRDADAAAVHGTDAAAVHAGAVWFRDAVEAHAALALRLASGAFPAGWFWRLAVPRWRPELPRDEALRAVLGSAAELAPGPFAAVAVLAELVERGAAGPLLGALRWQDGPALLRACGWQAPSAPVRLLRAGVFVVGDEAPSGDGERRAALASVPRAWADAIAARAGGWGEDDARTLWLASAALVTAIPARALDPRLPDRAARLVAAVLDAASPLAPRGDAVSADAAPAAEPVVARETPSTDDVILEVATQDARPHAALQAEGSIRDAAGELAAGDEAITPPPARETAEREDDRRVVEPPSAPADRPGSSAATDVQSRAPHPAAAADASPGERAAESRVDAIAPDLHPHLPSDAVAGDREGTDAAPAPHRSSISREAAVAEPADGHAVEMADARVSESPAVESSPIDPRTADARASESPAKPRYPERPLRTGAGGLAFLMPVLERLGISGMLRDTPWAADAAFPARLLRDLALRAGVAADDPMLAAFGCDGDLPSLPRAAAWSAPAAWAKGIAAPGERRVVETIDGGRAILDASGRLPLAAWRGDIPAAAASWLADAPASPRERDDALPHARTFTRSHPSELMLAAWTIAARRWTRRGARIGLATLVRRPARVLFTRTHADVVFDHRDADLRVRRAGLDVDPGWVPWLGRVVQVHYLYGERPGAS